MLKHFKLPNRHTLNKYIAAAILLFVPLYPKFPLFDIPGSQVNIRLEDFMIFELALIWLVVNIKTFLSILKNKIVIAVVLFLLTGLLSVAYAAFVTETVSLSTGVFHWLRRVQYLIPLFIGLTAVKSKDDIRFYIKLLLVIIIFAFIYGFGQKFYNWPIITTQNQEYARGIALFYVPGAHLVSTFAGHYDLAAFLVLISPLMYLLLLSPSKVIKKLAITPNTLVTRIVIAGVIFMTLWLLVNAASRISVAAYLGSVTFALLIARKYKWVPVVLAVCLVFILTSSKLMDRYVQIFEVYVERIISTVQIKEVNAQPLSTSSSLPTTTPQPIPIVEDRSTSIRLNVEWPRAIRAFQKNPLLGTGYSSITLATDNDYLRMLGETGLLGTMAFFLILGRMFVLFIKVITKYVDNDIRSIFIAGIIASLPGILLNMVFIDILEASKFATLFWLVIGICVSTCYQIYEKKAYNTLK